MQMEADRRPTPADLQAQLAPHLFGSGADDSGTASAWLPERAVRHDRGRAAAAARRHAPPAGARRSGRARPGPAAPAAGPPRRPSRARPRRGLARRPATRGSGRRRAGPRRPPTAGPVRLAGAPGARSAPARASPTPAPPPSRRPPPRPGLGRPAWSGPRRRRERRRGRGRRAAAVPPPGPARRAAGRAARPLAALAFPHVERRLGHPVRRRRSALRHLLRGARAGRGHRPPPFKTRDVAWAMAVADGRIHASDGPTLYALDARDGAERWRLQTDAWVYSLKVDRGTVVTGTRGGGVQAWEASNGEKLWEMHRRPDRLRDPRGRARACTTARSTSGRTPGCAPWRPAPATSAGRTRSATRPPAAACRSGCTRRPTATCTSSAGTRVLAIDIASGQVRWHFEAPGRLPVARPPSRPGPAVTGGGVYLADYLGTVYALDATDGRDRWRIATEARAVHRAGPGRPAATSMWAAASALYTLDAVTGTPQVALRGGRRGHRRPGRRRRPRPLRLGRPLPLHARRRAAASCAGSSPRAARSPAPRWRRGRRRVRVQQGPLCVRAGRGEGHGTGAGVTPPGRPASGTAVGGCRRASVVIESGWRGCDDPRHRLILALAGATAAVSTPSVTGPAVRRATHPGPFTASPEGAGSTRRMLVRACARGLPASPPCSWWRWWLLTGFTSGRAASGGTAECGCSSSVRMAVAVSGVRRCSWRILRLRRTTPTTAVLPGAGGSRYRDSNRYGSTPSTGGTASASPKAARETTVVRTLSKRPTRKAGT